jgi:iron complex outermembrane recepter protein
MLMQASRVHPRQSPMAAAITLVFLAAGASAQANAQNSAMVATENPAALTTVKAEDAPTKKLGTITVTGSRPSALPTHIPTTMESIAAADIAEKINATDAQDALKYFPSLMVRKRYIGDFDHAVLASRASGTGNSARSLVYADGILLSNLLGNGAAFTPRWGVVSPEEIERVDVLYGPYSAGFSGNSVGAVVDYITRMPSKLEASVKLQAFTQRFNLYGSNDRYSGNQWSTTLGSREGAFSWWLSFNHLNSDGHPIAFSNKVSSTGTVGTAGVAVTGAVADRNPTGFDWLLTGATNQIHTLQDNAKIKVAYDFSPTLRASYLFGQWRNDATRNVVPYLRDTSGNPVYSGVVNIAGRQYSIAANEISVSRQDLEHQIHGLSLKSNTGGVFDWEAAASLYDYTTDLSRAPAPTNALPAAFSGGAGRLTDLGGTGWNTLLLRGTWRPAGRLSGIDKPLGAHLVDFGLQREAFKLRTLISDTPDWQVGDAAARFSAFQGNTSLESIYAQDTWFFAPEWRSTIGLRLEKWQAKNGAISNATSTQTLAVRSETSASPKFALAYQATPQWVLKASLGRAVRNPTVAELYQGSISSNAVVNNDRMDG